VNHKSKKKYLIIALLIISLAISSMFTNSGVVASSSGEMIANNYAKSLKFKSKYEEGYNTYPFYI